ncbi:unnamed protein product [Miscanthus lutarioriparius]|uniref:Uncharacterized protein n=1 Tax=Miscanthus lutarioriparius TaxID=422564 RepID=A0A811RDY5_9POAL|nr:unnamed protein product [Miscanthus lutarioriparius]
MTETDVAIEMEADAAAKALYRDPAPALLLDTSELKKWCLYRALIAEFMATLIFLYVSIATVIGYKNQSMAEACTGVGFLGVAWSFGATIFILVYCTSGISGMHTRDEEDDELIDARHASGHINPAVTFGLFVGRKLSLVRTLLYIVAQCLGAICGVGIVKGIMKHPYNSLGGGANEVSTGYTIGGALAAEIVGTFILVYTVFSATDPKRTARDCSFVPVLLPLPIGFAVFVVHLATIPITGTGINPARSLGVAVLYNQHAAWKDHWIFWVGPLIGATVAALYHKLVLRG